MEIPWDVGNNRWIPFELALHVFGYTEEIQSLSLTICEKVGSFIKNCLD